MRVVKTALLALVAVGSQSPAQIWDENGQKMVVVWTVPSVFVSTEHVTNVLAMNGIRCACAGSIAYGVFVSPKDTERATRILRSDSTSYPWHYIGQDGLKSLVEKWEKNSKLWTFDVDMPTFRSDEALRKDANLRGLAREGFDQALRMFPNRKGHHPYLKSIRTWPMPYRGHDQQVHPADKGEVTIGFRLDRSEEFQATVYAWHEGTQTQFGSGSGQ